jgi:type VI secretion system protein ImpA
MNASLDQTLLDKLERLLAPISDAYPGGEDLQFHEVFDLIKEARRADDPMLPQGDWSTSLKVAEWGKVIQLCEAALSTQSKDLQLAVWYAEAQVHQDGYRGTALGFRLIAGLLGRFWEALYPRPDPNGELDERVSKLEWLDIQLDRVLREQPLVSPQYGGYNWYQWQASRNTENLKRRGADAYDKAIAEGAITGNAYDKGARDSGVLWFKELVADLAIAHTAYDDLVRAVNECFGPAAPSLSKMRAAFNDCSEVAKRFFGEYSGGMIAPEATFGSEGAQSESIEFSSPQLTVTTTPPADSRAEVIRKLHAASYWFRSHEPHSPVPLLIERAIHWAEMSFEDWLSEVIKDKATLDQLGELLKVEIGISAGIGK